MNLPEYQFLPAPLWLITALHVLTLTLHFVAMNFLFGGIMILLFAKIADRWNRPVVGRFVRLFPTVMSLTVTLGVAPLLFAQLVYHRQIYAASIVSGWYWFGIVAAALAGYYFLYAAAFSSGGPRTGLYLTAALVLFAYVSFVYSTVFSMAERPDLIETLYRTTQNGTAINPDTGSWIWRWPHMLLGALTVGAYCVGFLGRDDQAIARLARNVFLGGMVLTMLVGLGWLLSQIDLLKPFMRSAGIWWLSASIVLSLGSLHFYFRGRFIPAGAMLFVSILGMVMVRHVFRLLHLSGRLDPGTIPIRPQTSVFFLFLACFVLALGTVAFMLRVFFRERNRAV